MHTDGYIAAIPLARLDALKRTASLAEDKILSRVLGLVCPCIRGEHCVCDALVHELRSGPGRRGRE